MPHADNSNSHRLRRIRIGAFGLAAAGPRPESAAVAAQCGPPHADEQACAGYRSPEEESVMKCSSPDCNGRIGRRDAGVKCCTSDPQPMRSGRQLYARHATWRKVGKHVREAIDSHPAKTPREPFSWKFGPAVSKVKCINLALQGGSAHGAFTWGVLDRHSLKSRVSRWRE